MRVAPRSDRRQAIAWGCVSLLAREGSRGLNHRAVDQLLSFPPGSTSYYFRTTLALWRAASEVLADADRVDVESHLKDGLVDTEGLLALWTSAPRRDRLLARFELSLAAARDDLFRTLLAAHRQAFLTLVAEAMRTLGRPDPWRAAQDEVALFEGRLLQQAVFASEESPVTRSATDPT